MYSILDRIKILILLIMWVVVFFFFAYLRRDRYTQGAHPVENVDFCLMHINAEVFDKVNSDSCVWLKIVNSSSRYLQLCAKDSVKFKSIFEGKDNLSSQTVKKFGNYGFKYGMDEDLGLCFSLPREEGWGINKETKDYIVIPTWLVVALIDEHVLKF